MAKKNEERKPMEDRTASNSSTQVKAKELIVRMITDKNEFFYVI